MPVKQITNWTAFGEIQTATVTFFACLTRFRFISHPLENLPLPMKITSGILIPTAALPVFIDFCTQQWLILLQWRYDMLCISGFTDDVIFGHISLH